MNRWFSGEQYLLQSVVTHHLIACENNYKEERWGRKIDIKKRILPYKKQLYATMQLIRSIACCLHRWESSGLEYKHS